MPPAQDEFLLINKGLELHRQGRLADADQLYADALRINPNNPETLHFRGIVALQSKRPADATALIGQAIALKGDRAEYHCNLGAALRALGDSAAAIKSYEQAIRLAPGYIEAHYNMGNALQGLGRMEEAASCFRHALGLDPNHPGANINMSLILLKAARPKEAEALLRRARASQPDNPVIHANLGLSLKDQNRPDEALDACRAALRLDPRSVLAHTVMGFILKNEGQIGPAIDSLRQAEGIEPNNAETLNILGNALQMIGDVEGALAVFDKALAVAPGFADARFNRSVVLLSMGWLAEAWPDYEERCNTTLLQTTWRKMDRPQWDGRPLDGRTILLHAEQGLGDSLQFIRYAPLVAARGGRVIVELQPSLLRLCDGMPEIHSVVAQGAPLPDFDLHCPLPSLPLAFRTTLDSVPADVPYLRPRAADVERWSARLAPSTSPHRALRVGLVWAGNPKHSNDRRRSVPLEALADLGRIAGVTFYSLQVGPAAEQAAKAPPPLRLTALGDDLTDFAETAAVMANLDLLIAVDTAPAHLAGAIGLPVWLLVPFNADWRWMTARPDTPWYPTMRLFRQPELGAWRPTIERLVAALAERACAPADTRA